MCLSLIGITDARGQMTTITAANIQNGFGAKLPSGTLCMTATDANANYIAIQLGGKVYPTGTPFCSAVSLGGVALSVPNPANTTPANIHYTVLIKQGPQQVMACPLVQPAGSSYDLDTFILANCTITGGSASAGPLYINVTAAPFNAQGNGQVGIGTVSSPLNQITVTTSTRAPAAGDVGDALWISEAPYGAPLLTNSYTCTNAGVSSFPSCGGTGTLGNSTDTHVYYKLLESGSNGSGPGLHRGVCVCSYRQCRRGRGSRHFARLDQWRDDLPDIRCD